ncbi:MAG: DnaB helicase C-terminal domain-containing protein, partial [Actinomycetota bacterium]|nr:DnaB helicase C-terminal domain-containing protein [Actinomycetota bacterium]
MDSELQSLSGVMEQTDHRLKTGSHAAPRVWSTGFRTLDGCLSGGFRSGELILLTGPQGLGKTTYALQMLRYLACAGRSAVYFSFEHDSQTLLERLVAMEAGMIVGTDGVTLDRVRESFEGSDGATGSLAERLAETEGGREAIEAIETYAERLLLHRSTGSKTTLDTIRRVVEEVSAETKQLPFVVVDYLQKVKLTDGPRDEEERVTAVVEGLKDLALDLDIPVLAVVA